MVKHIKLKIFFLKNQHKLQPFDLVVVSGVVCCCCFLTS